MHLKESKKTPTKIYNEKQKLDSLKDVIPVFKKNLLSDENAINIENQFSSLPRGIFKNILENTKH